MQPRLVKLRAYLRKHKIEVAIFFSATNDPNFVYFTKSDASGILVVPASSKPFIITNKMEFERLVRGSIIREIVVSDGKRISTIISKRVPRIARIGINKSSVTVRVLEELKRNLKARYVDVGEFCARLTQIKLREEIQAITRSCKITERIFTETIKGKAKIRGFCVMDFGVGYKHLNSDFTRTVYIGRAKDTEVRVFNAVLEAERAILKAIKPGMKCSELARIGKRALGNYSKHILHSFGHGVGVDVHESPVISESSNQVLKPGMVLAVEPGVYLPGKFGVRLEDMALVTEQSMKLLTKPLDTLITL